MRRLWEDDQKIGIVAQAAEMGLRAEARYWEYFTGDKMVRSYVDLYGDLTKQHHQPAV